jgi:long-chain acyl-CoA synthetase
MMDSFWLRAQKDPHYIALVTPDGNQLTSDRLCKDVNRLVDGLCARGLELGDVVATLLPNGAPLITTLLGVMQAGWHYTAINSHLLASEIADILADAGAKAFISHACFAQQAAEAADKAGIPAEGRIAIGEIPSFGTFESLLEGQSTERPNERVAGQFMQYTSGTTGSPKAVQREIPQMDADAMVSALAVNLERYDITPGGEDVHLVTSPMYHMAPLSFAYFSLHFGHRVVLMESWDAERALELIESERVTTTHMVPTQFHRLMRLPRAVRQRYDVSSLRNVMHAAAPCPIALKQEMLDWWGPVIYEYYGATEGGGTMVGPREWLEKPGTVGRPWPGADVRILDDDGSARSAGEVGTVYMKLLVDFKYKDAPEKTAKDRRDGYFTVGDVGLLDEDGYLFLRDRKIDMIISGGVNIYPAEVEAALLAHRDVADAAVFGIPHAEWGEEVRAVVQLDDVSAGDAKLEAALLAHCAERLAKYKCPRHIDFVKALPRDANGKLYKRRLRDPYWEGQTRSI